jgi:hypothetical protein
MNMTDEPPAVNFDQPGQPTPVSLLDEPRPDAVFGRTEVIHGFGPKVVPESLYLGEPPFRQQQTESFPSNPIYQQNYPERLVHQAPPGIQAFPFEPNPPEWQQTASPSVISPVASQGAVNTPFSSTYDQMDASWDSAPHITQLPFSSHPPSASQTIADAPPMMVQMQQPTTRSYSVSEGMPITVNQIHQGYPLQSAVDGMMRPFDGSITPVEFLGQQQQRHAFAPWPVTRAPPQSHIPWPAEYMPPPNSQE